MTSITIPESIVRIYEQAFANCTNLTTVNFNAVNCEMDGEYYILQDYIESSTTVFANCNALATVNFGENVTRISSYAFAGCSALTSVTIPNSVTAIDDEAFAWTGLTSITIPESITSIGWGVFENCLNLTVVNFNAVNLNNANHPFFICPSSAVLNIGENVTTIPGNVFCAWAGLSSINIPNSVTSIGDFAFISCSGLTEITIPESVAAIGLWAFDDCTNLTTINIPNLVTVIRDHAFSNTGLTTITIPNAVTTIEDYAFSSCSSLTSITILANIPPALGENCFDDVMTNDVNVYVPCGKKQAYQNADGWNDFDNIQLISGEEFPYTVTVAVAEDSEGFGSVEVLQQPDCEDPSFMILANPMENYQFVSWSDGNTENPRTIIVTENAMFYATFAATTDIEASVATNIYIFPNPTGNILNITSSEMISSVEFVSITGQIISRVDVNGETAVCNVEGFAPGIYFVRISGNDGSVIQRKFVKE